MGCFLNLPASIVSRAPIGRFVLSVLCAWAFVFAGQAEAEADLPPAGGEQACVCASDFEGSCGAAASAAIAESNSQVDVVDPQEEEEKNEQASRGALREREDLQPRGCTWFIEQRSQRSAPRPVALGVGVRGPPATHTR